MRKFDWIKAGMVCSIGALLFGCATLKEAQLLEKEVDKLRSEISLLQIENDSLKNNLFAENQNLRADLLVKLETLQSEVRILSTGVGECKDYLNQPSKEMERIKRDVESRERVLEEKRKNLDEKNKLYEEKIKEVDERLKSLGEIEAVVPKKKLKKSIPAERVSSNPTQSKSTSDGMLDLYKDAYETFRRGDLEEAQRKFETFLKHYPNAELSVNARFWIAETYYKRKDFGRAILEYEKCVAQYPEGGKTSAALFKEGLAFLEIGDIENGRRLLRKLIERYPDSDQAEMAKRKLKGIK